MSKKTNTCRVGLAVYDFDWVYGTGTERFAHELTYALVNLKQSIIEYKILLRPGISAAQIGLPPEICLNAPTPSYSLLAKIRRKSHYLWHKGIDVTRELMGACPLLGYLGKLWIKDWLTSLNLDLLYFPSMWQYELIQDIPIVVQLHDMQHIHYPEFWKDDIFQRQVVFGWYRDHACLITCNFDFVANDIKLYLKVPKEKIATIFLAPSRPPLSDAAYELSIRKKFNLPQRYIIYPAATWPHKNHINLVRAIAQCVSSGIDVFCVCTGEHADWLYPGQFLKIQEEIKKCKVEKNICFTGCLASSEIYALLQGADFVVIPTIYEAGCYPIWEACHFGKAVACSDVTMIPYQIQDAGLLFNPHEPDDIAGAIGLLWKNQELKSYLGHKAKALIDHPFYSAEKMALGYHRQFIHCLIRLGKLPKELWINEDPAPVLDRGALPLRFEWRQKG